MNDEVERMVKELREAGLDAWDDVDDIPALLERAKADIGAGRLIDHEEIKREFLSNPTP